MVDDETSVTGALNIILGESGYEVAIAHTVAQATRFLSAQTFDVVLTDFRLADGTGIDLIMHIKKEAPDTEVILMSGFGSLDMTIEAIKRGAYYYIEKPCAADRILALIARALEFGALKHENQVLKRTLAGDSEVFGMIGRDPKMRQIIETIRTAAPSDASVLIEGESGTGKELIATALHTQSHRASAPFIRINCAAIPHELIESELFGYKKGAFTGADRDKRGTDRSCQRRDAFCWMKSRKCLPISKPNCCAYYKSASCAAWVTSVKSMWIFVSCPRPTGTPGRW